METIDIAFGEVLALLRREQKFSQRQLAAKSCLHSTFISMLERGRRQPSLQTLFDIAHGLEIEATEFLYLILQHQERATRQATKPLNIKLKRSKG